MNIKIQDIAHIFPISRLIVDHVIFNNETPVTIGDKSPLKHMTDIEFKSALNQCEIGHNIAKFSILKEYFKI